VVGMATKMHLKQDYRKGNKYILVAIPTTIFYFAMYTLTLIVASFTHKN
jgi:hypothetical protein